MRLKRALRDLAKQQGYYKKQLRRFNQDQQKWVERQRDVHRKSGVVVKYVFIDDIRKIEVYKKRLNRIKIHTRDGDKVTVRELQIVDAPEWDESVDETIDEMTQELQLELIKKRKNTGAQEGDEGDKVENADEPQSLDLTEQFEDHVYDIHYELMDELSKRTEDLQRINKIYEAGAAQDLRDSVRARHDRWNCRMADQLKFDQSDDLPEMGEKWQDALHTATKRALCLPQREDTCSDSSVSLKRSEHGDEDGRADFAGSSSLRSGRSGHSALSEESIDKADTQRTESTWMQLAEDAATDEHEEEKYSFENAPTDATAAASDQAAPAEAAANVAIEANNDHHKCADFADPLVVSLKKENSSLTRRLKDAQAKVEATKQQYSILHQAVKRLNMGTCNTNHATNKGRARLPTIEQATEAEALALRASMYPIDERYVCWDFNSSKGCDKANGCWWSHQWLRDAARHPWTGEPLPGIVQRYREDPDCRNDTKHRFHNNGFTYQWRNNEYLGRGDYNR